MNKIGLVLPGNFSRLAGHHAFGHAWFHACQKGFPPPHYITGSSAGGIAAANIAHWDEDYFKKTEAMLLNLERSEFLGLNPKLKRSGALAAMTSLALILPTHKIKNPYFHFITNVLLAGTVLYMDRRFLKNLFTCESFFVLNNLLDLLRRNYDPHLLFNSPINVEIPTVDINQKCWRSVTNFKPMHKDLEMFINGVVDGARVWVFFDPRKDIDGGYNVDAAALSNIPIHFAVENSCETIVIALYNSPLDGLVNEPFDRWIKSLQRCFDLVVSENTRKTLRGYLTVNNDLAQLEKERLAIDLVEQFIEDSADTIEANKMKSLSDAVFMAREAQRNYSFVGKKIIKLVVIGSDPLPAAHFSDFDQERTREAINICYQAFWDNQNEILKAIEG